MVSRGIKKYGRMEYCKKLYKRTLEMINFKEINVKFVGRSACNYCDGKCQQTSCTTKRNIRKDTKRQCQKNCVLLGRSVTEATGLNG